MSEPPSAPARGAVLKRKIALRLVRTAPPAVLTAERALAQALTRAAHAEIGLDLSAEAGALQCLSLAELLETSEAPAFFAVLTGRAEKVALLTLDSAAVSALVEMMTVSRVNPAPSAPRRPTRTDAAMLAPLIDAALSALDALTAETPALRALAAYSYGSFFDEPRPLMMVLEDGTYQQATLRLRFNGLEGRDGLLRLAWPEEGAALRLSAPASAPAPAASPESETDPSGFTAALRSRVMATPALVEALLTRFPVPIGTILGWRPGDLVPLGEAALDALTLCGANRQPLAQVRLGQHRGLRALRLVSTTLERHTLIEDGPGSSERGAALARAHLEDERPEESAGAETADWDADLARDLGAGGDALFEPTSPLAAMGGLEADITHVSDLPPLAPIPALDDMPELDALPSLALPLDLVSLDQAQSG